MTTERSATHHSFVWSDSPSAVTGNICHRMGHQGPSRMTPSWTYTTHMNGHWNKFTCKNSILWAGDISPDLNQKFTLRADSSPLTMNLSSFIRTLYTIIKGWELYVDAMILLLDLCSVPPDGHTPSSLPIRTPHPRLQLLSPGKTNTVASFLYMLKCPCSICGFKQDFAT